MSDSNSGEPPHTWPISANAEYDVEHGVVFPNSSKAFQYTTEHVNAMVRSVRASMQVILNLEREPYTVLETDWFPETQSKENIDLDIPYTAVGATVEAGPVEKCEFIAVLEKDDTTNRLVTVRAPPGRETKAIWSVYQGKDLPETTAVETLGVYTPEETGTVDRLARVPPKEIESETSARQYCDGEINTATHGPTADKPVEKLELSGPFEKVEQGEVASLPNRLEAIDRCPVCSSAVVLDNTRDRVICIDCRRWCSLREWSRYHKPPRDDIAN